MEDREIARRLRGFEAVWKRVRRSKTEPAKPGAPLMPRRRCVRRRRP